MVGFITLSVCFNLFLILIIFTSGLTYNRNRDFFSIQTRDPNIHIEHHTYARLTFLRGHVVSEHNLNKKGDCSRTCSDYNQTKYYHHSYNSSIKPTLECNGNIYACRKVHHFSMFQTMRVDNQLYRLIHNKKTDENEFRKFENPIIHYFWTQQHKNDVYDSLYDTSHCDICKCYCDDINNKYSVRSFCQDIILANTDQGYVITGLRFAIKNSIVMTEIQQGKLVNGVIDRDTVHWKTSNTCQFYGYLNFEHRSIQLDDMIVPFGQVITAVSWNRYHHPTKKLGYSIGRLSLLVRGTDLDARGNLIPQEWTAYHKIDVRRTHLKLKRVDIPTSARSENIEMRRPNKYYIKFQPTDWFKDFAQHVVPYIDLQEVTTDPPRPLSGIGIYYKATEGYGGFISFRIMFNKSMDNYYDVRQIY